MKKNRKNINYLDLIPLKKEGIGCEINENNRVVLRVENKGFFNKLAQVAFSKPRFSNIELEEYGSFIWEYIDGKNSVYDIAKKVEEKFGEDAFPLYERICKYFGIMEENGLIFFNW